MLRYAWIIAEGSEYFQCPWSRFRKLVWAFQSSWLKNKIMEYEVDKIACTNASSELALWSNLPIWFTVLILNTLASDFSPRISHQIPLRKSSPLITLNREDCRNGDNRRCSGRFIYPIAGLIISSHRAVRFFYK